MIDIPQQKQNVSRRSSKGIFVALIIALVLTFAVVQTGAALELNWADGIWQNAAGSPPPTCLKYKNTPLTSDENQVAYGSDVYPPSCPSTADVTKQSGFGFDGCENETITTGVDFDLGNFTHYNNPIYVYYGFSTVELSVTLSFHIDANNTDVRKTLNYTFDLDETPNGGTCVYPSTTPCADRVLVLNTIPDETFWIGGKEYTLHIVGFVHPGQVIPVNQFITQERQRNDAVLVAELLVAEPAIEVEKATNGIDADDPPGPYIPVGDPVIWTYNVTNIGTINLTNVVVTDDPGVIVTCPNNTLLIGENMSCTAAAGTATAGQYANSGNASGVPQGGGSSVSDTDPSHYFGCDPDINITKEANVSSATIGTVIGYNITVKNTGNVNLTSVLVTDVKLNLSHTIANLIPNASQSFYQTYTVTESDICAPINNTATANGTDPCGGAVGPVSASVSVPTTYTTGLSITKTANVTSATVGTVIGYNITVNNTGNVNLTNVLVTDSLTGLSQTIPNLIPNASRTFNPSYTVTQADICAPINNTATANGTDPCGGAVGPETASVSVPTTLSPSLAITKTANVSSATVGTVIGYNITVNNTGNVNLTNVLVTDSLTGLSQTIPNLIPKMHLSLTIQVIR